MAEAKGKSKGRSKSSRSSAGQKKPPADLSVADRVEKETRDWSERLARSLARSAERAREELVDIWAEAQNIRRGR